MDREQVGMDHACQGIICYCFLKMWVRFHATVMVVSLCGLNIGFFNYPIHLICREEDFMKSDTVAVLVKE